MRISVIPAVMAVAFLAGCAGTGNTPRTSKAFPFGPQDLMVHTPVAGAHIYIDGQPCGDLRAEQLFCLGYGTHSVVVESPGYARYETTVYIAPLNCAHLMVDLAPLPGEEAARLRAEHALAVAGSLMGSVEITVDVPATEVYIDGRFYGHIVSKDCPQTFALPVGMHRVVLKHKEYENHRVAIDVDGQNVPKLVVTMVSAM